MNLWRLILAMKVCKWWLILAKVLMNSGANLKQELNKSLMEKPLENVFFIREFQFSMYMMNDIWI